MPEEQFEDELSLLDIFNIVWRKKFFIIFITFISAVLSLWYAMTRDFTYRGECRILPPQGRGTSGILSQFGGLADFVGLPNAATSGQMMIGIIKGDSVVDNIIDKFNLMERYSNDIRLRVRAATIGNLETAEDNKSGIISIAFIDKEPKFAADVANAFVSELQKKLQEISLADAQQRRNFFENQLKQAQQELNDVESDMINYQQSKGVIALESQASALLASIASLRNRIAAKNVEISTLSSYAKRDNPRLKLLQSELDAMTKELRKLEEEQSRADGRRRTQTGDLLSSIGDVPELGIEYQRYVRALQFATAKYEMMLRQYENARLSEANDLSTISIIDYATPPDYKYGPKRGRIVIMGTAMGLALSLFWSFLSEHFRAMRKARREREYDEDFDE
ncbi:MAG: hypothetical protein IJU48_03365 [Synergistaceae bacterium]|nr:hypothetical protein [Synergistaceae bacterium]